MRSSSQATVRSETKSRSGNSANRAFGMNDTNVLPPTYKMFSPRDTVPASCCFVRSTGNYQKIVNIKPKGFQDRIELTRDPPVYKLCIVPSNGAELSTAQQYVPLTEIKKFMVPISSKKRNNLTIVFRKFLLELNFEYRVHFLYFTKIIEEFQDILDYNEEDSMIDLKVPFVSYEPEKQQSGLSGFRSVVSDPRRHSDIYVKKVTDWGPNLYMEWLDHIYVQFPKTAPKVSTVLEVLKSEKLTETMLQYLSQSKTFMHLLRATKNFDASEESSELYSILSHDTLRTAIRRGCERLKSSKVEFSGNDYIFNYPFHICLKKRLKVLDDSIKKEEISLNMVLDFLESGQRYLWNVEDCRDKLLSILLFSKNSLEEVMNEKEDEFHKFEKDWFVQKLPKELEWDDPDQQYLFAISSSEWDKCITRFNAIHFGVEPDLSAMHISPDVLDVDKREVSIRIQDVSFRIKCLADRNEMRRRYEEMAKILKSQKNVSGGVGEEEEEDGEDNISVDEIRRKIEMCQKKISRFEGLIAKQVEKNAPKKNVDRVRERVKKEKDAMSELKNRLKVAEEKMKKLTEEEMQRLEEDVEELKEDIIDCEEAFRMAERGTFLKDPKRRRMIQKFVRSQLREYSKRKRNTDPLSQPSSDFLGLFVQNKKLDAHQKKIKKVQEKFGRFNMTEFGVQLCISILKDYEPSALHAILLKPIDKFLKPEFYKWGFIHANVQVSNLGTHFFSDSLVMMTNMAVGRNYEEVLAIDCNCAMLADFRTVYGKILKLAREIVNVNVNYHYEKFTITNATNCLNCQEFANKILGSLNATEFHPVVESYLGELKNELEKSKPQSARDLRYITIDATLKKKFFESKKNKNSQVEEEEEDEDFNLSKFFRIEKKNRVYFRRHRDLDYFMLCLLDMDEDFEFHHPGYFQLLKAFDRGFWISESKNDEKDDPSLRPLESGCPFNRTKK